MPDDKNRQKRGADAQSAFGGFGSWSADHTRRQNAAAEERNKKEQERANIIKDQVQGIVPKIPTVIPDLPEITPTSAPIDRTNISRSLLGSPANEDIARSLNQIA